MSWNGINLGMMSSPLSAIKNIFLNKSNVDNNLCLFDKQKIFNQLWTTGVSATKSFLHFIKLVIILIVVLNNSIKVFFNKYIIDYEDQIYF